MAKLLPRKALSSALPLGRPVRRLSSTELRREWLGRLREAEGLLHIDAKRLDRLVECCDSQGIVAARDAWQKLFPEMNSGSADVALRNFRSRVNQAAQEAGISLTLESNKKHDLSTRQFWFEGPDDTMARAVSFMREAVSDIQLDRLVSQRGFDATPPTAPRETIEVFISFADEDRLAAVKLLQPLTSGAKPARDYQFNFWSRFDMVAGDDWEAVNRAKRQNADIGLMLWSPAFLADTTTKDDHEALKSSTVAAMLPVLLKPLAQNHDQSMLGSAVPFVLSRSSGRDLSWTECRIAAERDEFVNRLFDSLCAHAKAVKTTAKSISEQEPPPAEPGKNVRLFEAFARSQYFETDIGPDEFVPTQGVETSLDRLDDADLVRARAKSRDALELLEDWIDDPEGPIFCAVLGEYGIGKTTTLKRLTDRMLKRLGADGSRPGRLPIFIDLRYYSEAIRAGRVPSLNELLQEVIDRSWQVTTRGQIKAENIVEFVREHGALVIFDGLDEKLVHLDQQQAQAFIRELWSILPAVHFRHEAATKVEKEGKKVGRVLFSCRSHYFKSLREQHAAFIGEHREANRANDYRACVLLPFNEGQVRDYLAKMVGEKNVNSTMDLFASVHNLRELSRRPFLLKLIVSQIGRLEEQIARGDSIRGISLYDGLVRDWLARDEGKHRFRPEDKRRLMEDVALAMWRDHASEWEWDKLRDWLAKRIAEDDVMRTLYLTGDGFNAHRHFDLLGEDFRTATLILRPPDRNEGFRFAHTSLQEYFLALGLARALLNDTPKAWDVPVPSNETLVFLSQWFETIRSQDHSRAEKTLHGLLGGGSADARRLAFNFWMRGFTNGFFTAGPQRIDLDEMNMDGWEIGSDQRKLKLGTVTFRGARLNDTRFRNVEFGELDLSRASVLRAEFQNVTISAMKVAETDLSGSIWRLVRARVVSGYKTADWSGAQWILSECLDDSGQPLDDHKLEIANERMVPALSISRASHNTMMAWAPGDRTFATTEGKMIRLWDRINGRCLNELKGHVGIITNCAWSRDGNFLVSGSFDRTARIWSAKDGSCCRILDEHSHWVTAVAWSVDGQRIATGDDRGMVAIWAAHTGKRLARFRASPARIQSCSWNKQGHVLITSDYAMVVQDSESGRVLHSFGQEYSGAEWTPDGASVALVGTSSLNFYHMATGKRRNFPLSHLSLSCVFNKDGSVVAVRGEKGLHFFSTDDAAEIGVLSADRVSPRKVEISSSGTQVLLASDAGQVQVWNLKEQSCEVALLQSATTTLAVAWHPESEVVAATTSEGIRFWNINNGSGVITPKGHTDWVRGCSWSPDGRRFASGAYDRAVRIWNARSATCARIVTAHSDRVEACVWSPDSHSVASAGSDRRIMIYNMQSGQKIQELHGHRDIVRGCVWSPDGEHLLSFSDDMTGVVWNIHQGKRLLSLGGHENAIWCGAWHSDGSMIATGSFDTTIRIWDPVSGREMRRLTGHKEAVRGCAWHPRQHKLASVSHDGTLRIWDMLDGATIRVVELEGSLNSCSWNRDGSKLAIASAEIGVLVWDVSQGKLIESYIELPGLQSAAIDWQHNRFKHASKHAWRHLGWRVAADETAEAKMLPAEYFGPLAPSET